MKAFRKCYAVVVASDTFDGTGRPIIMESYLDLSLREVMDRAEILMDTYGGALVVELPITMKTEFQRIAGSTEKVFSPGGSS